MGPSTSQGEQRRGGLWRSRWAAIGAAVAVTFGAGGMAAVNAAASPASSVVTVDPVRVLDTRDPVNIGLPGPFVSAVSQKLQVTGTAGVPAGATGVLLNVTVASPSAAGFLSIRPGDATGAPSTSSLNFDAGQTVPNSVQVGLPTAGANAGQIDITYDAYGVAGPTTEVLIDVVGYMSADVYTKAQTDAGFLAQGEIVQSHGLSFENLFGVGTRIANVGGVSSFTSEQIIGQQSLTGPESIGGVQYGLKSVTYCMDTPFGNTAVRSVSVISKYQKADQFTVEDSADRTVAGCYTLQVNNSSSDSYVFWVQSSGTTGGIHLTSLKSTWAPASTLPS